MSKERVHPAEKLMLRAKTTVGELVERARTGKKPRQIIFIHVPKCAGTSAWKQIKASVGPRWMGRTVMLLRDPSPSDPGYEALIERCRRARFVSGHISWDTAQAIRGDRDAFVFTVLRDPAERLYSLYRYLRKIAGTHRSSSKPPIDPAIARMTLAEFLGHPSPTMRQSLDNYMTRQFAGSLAEMPSTDDEGRAMLARAKSHLARLDHVCFQETFDDDFPHLLSRANIPLRSRTLRTNTTQSHQEGARKQGADRLPPDEHIERLIKPLIRLDTELVDFARRELVFRDQR